MKPICVPCLRFYRPEKNGISFTEGMPITDDALPGIAEPDNWRPYKLWQGDLWRCAGCGNQIIVGTGFDPIAEHYESGFSDIAARCGGDQLQINDC